VLQGMSVSKMPAWGEEEFCVIPISVTGSEISKMMGSIWPATHKGMESNGFRGNTGEDIKRMGGDNFREVRDHGNAVPGIGSLIRRGVNGRSGMRKSRGRVRT